MSRSDKPLTQLVKQAPRDYNFRNSVSKLPIASVTPYVPSFIQQQPHRYESYGQISSEVPLATEGCRRQPKVTNPIESGQSEGSGSLPLADIPAHSLDIGWLIR